MIEYDKDLIYIKDDDNEGVNWKGLSAKSSRLITVRCVKCDGTWNTRPRELSYNRTNCPHCRLIKKAESSKVSTEYYEILFPMLLDKTALNGRGDSSGSAIDVLCPVCHKAFRVTLKKAIERLKAHAPLCLICHPRKGGKTGELFKYNYQDMLSRIKGEIPEEDFLLATSKKFTFKYDCGHYSLSTPKRFVKNHSLCCECKNLVKPEKASYDIHKTICSKCNKTFEVAYRYFRSNTSKHNGLYICKICASSKGIRLSEKLRGPEFTHVFWSEKNEFSPDDITASSGRRVILKCVRGHEWSPFAYAIGGCPRCAQLALVSREEQGLVDFVRSLVGEDSVRTSVRDVIPPKELDVYVPSRGVAVEFNGMYWHSEENGKHRGYHFDKWLACRDKGVTLISVWEDDWLYRRGIVERVIESTLLTDKHFSHSNHDAPQSLSVSVQKVVTPSVDTLNFISAYGLFEQQCLMDSAPFFVVCRDDSRGLVSVSGVLERPGFVDVQSHVCIPGFECSLSSVIGFLKTDGAEVGVLECNDYPLLSQHTLESAGLSWSRVVDSARRSVLYAHNRYFRVSKCDVDDVVHVWNSGYTLWYG